MIHLPSLFTFNLSVSVLVVVYTYSGKSWSRKKDRIVPIRRCSKWVEDKL